MRLPRMTTRRMMIAVAVVGVLFAVTIEGARLVRRWDYCRSMASYHDARDGTYQGSWVPDPAIPLDPVNFAYHTRMRRKWEHAAWRPWLPMPPDPSPPK